MKSKFIFFFFPENRSKFQGQQSEKQVSKSVKHMWNSFYLSHPARALSAHSRISNTLVGLAGWRAENKSSRSGSIAYPRAQRRFPVSISSVLPCSKKIGLYVRASERAATRTSLEVEVKKKEQIFFSCLCSHYLTRLTLFFVVVVALLFHVTRKVIIENSVTQAQLLESENFLIYT